LYKKKYYALVFQHTTSEILTNAIPVCKYKWENLLQYLWSFPSQNEMPFSTFFRHHVYVRWLHTALRQIKISRYADKPNCISQGSKLSTV